MADLQRMVQALQAADAAGDTEAASALAQEIRRLQEQPQQAPAPVQPEAPPMSRWDAIKQGAIEGAKAGAGWRGGLLETALSLGTGAAATPLAGVAGAVATPFVGADKAADVVTGIQGALTYSPRSPQGRTIAGAVSYPFEKIQQAGDASGQFAANLTGSPAVGAAVNTAVQSAPALLTRGRVGSRGNPSPNRPGRPVAAGEAEAPRPVSTQAERSGGLEPVPRTASRQAAPSIEELRSAKDAAYKAADESGVVVSEAALNRLKVNLYRATKGGNEKLYPKATAALQHVLEQRGAKSLTNLEDLRKVANDAKMSPDKADARLGGILVRVIDDFSEGITPKDLMGGDAAKATAFKEARALNARLAKAETIDDIFKSARRATGANYTVAGMETALRQKFRQLADNKKKMRGFNAEERAAIEQFIEGGKADNFLRKLGKFAPDGVISGWSAIGAAAINPLLAAFPAAGTVAKFASTRRGIKNANRISEMVRGGPLQEARQPVNRLAEMASPPR